MEELKPTSLSYWAHVLQVQKPVHLELMLHNKGSHHNEKFTHHNQRVGPACPTTEKSAQQQRPNIAKIE